MFVGAGTNRWLVESVRKGSTAQVLELDPLGVGLTPGNTLYQQLLTNMVDTMRYASELLRHAFATKNRIRPQNCLTRAMRFATISP